MAGTDVRMIWMQQAIQKFSRYCERWFRELLTEYAALLCGFAIVVVVILLFLEEQANGAEKIRSIVYAVGAVLAASITFIQWASDRRVKRAELVDRLIEKITTIDPNSLMEERGSGETRELEKQDQDFSSKLSFLSYIAYLKATGILSDDEFNAMRLDLVRILEHVTVVGMIEEACNGNKDSEYIPYRYLVEYGAANCKSDSAERYKKILASRDAQTHQGIRATLDSELSECPRECDGSEIENPVPENAGQDKECAETGTDEGKMSGPGTEEVIDSVSSGKTYGTHVEVLNGIFKFSYRAHMRGGATLPDGREVWFPKYYDSSRQEPIQGPPAKWVNILDSEKGVISEYWPLGVEMTDERLDHWNKKPRYVFGMDLSKPTLSYRFLGIYQFERREEDHLVYKRQNVDLLRSEVENSLNPDCY